MAADNVVAVGAAGFGSYGRAAEVDAGGFLVVVDKTGTAVVAAVDSAVVVAYVVGKTVEEAVVVADAVAVVDTTGFVAETLYFVPADTVPAAGDVVAVGVALLDARALVHHDDDPAVVH